MKQSKYPRVGAVATCRRGLCRVCGKPRSDKAIIVEVSRFRDDDEVFPVHAICVEGKKPAELLQMLVDKGLV